MDPSLSHVWQGFQEERNRDLFHKFPGFFRAIVMETNDPLRIGRVRFLMPEIHNSDLKSEDCPWAVPSPTFGGWGAGSWVSPCIGDHVWIAFEKSHAYGPIWVGGADPTRRKRYPLPSVSGKTPLAVNGEGKPADSPKDYDEQYHPKDGRPMSYGFHDRYGNTDIFSSVGFFPKEHAAKPAQGGVDGVSKKDFETSENAPKSNDPDVKYAARITKYGTYCVHSDVGFKWDNEFKGDFEKDAQFEIDRWKYFLGLLNEGKPKDFDQRRWEARTRLGHKIEMRDVGWDKSRAGEYDDKQNTIGSSNGRDERWLKFRSKGGAFLEMIDVGSDPEQDLYIKRLLKSETGTSTEKEGDLGRDQRMIRVQTRWGIKQVMDDRGSDSKDATGKEEPRGNGWFVKGRRANRGFHIGFNEKDEYNNFIISSPKGKSLELNDRFGYVGMSTDTVVPLSEERIGHYGIEWPSNQLLGLGFEYATYHVKLDKKNKYIRMKTPTGQGSEFRDRGGEDGCRSWAETRDVDDRGMWWNSDGGYTVWRSKDEKQYVVLHDAEDYILIKNVAGKIQIIANGGDIELKTDQNINMQARTISMKADTSITMEAGGNQAVLNGALLGTLKSFKCKDMSGRHTAIQIPAHPVGPAPEAPTGGPTNIVVPNDVVEKKPKPQEGEDRGCAPNRKQAGPVPPENAGGGGGPGGNTPGSPTTPPDDTPPPLPTPDAPLPDTQPPSATPPPPYEDPPPDPLGPDGPGGSDAAGCLWYGTSDLFIDEISQVGLLVDSFANNQMPPEGATHPDKFVFTTDIDIARGEDFALLAQKRYGGHTLILRIVSVDEPEKLTFVENKLVEYTGTVIQPSQIEVFEIGQELLP